jgi:anti-sigma factor RsiW
MPGACEEWRDVLPDLAAGDLDDARTAEAERHVAVCPVCARERARMAAVMGAATGWEAPPLTADFADRVMARVVTERTRDPAPVWPRWLAAAAAAVLLAGVGLRLALRGPARPTPSHGVQQALGGWNAAARSAADLGGALAALGNVGSEVLAAAPDVVHPAETERLAETWRDEVHDVHADLAAAREDLLHLVEQTGRCIPWL